MKKQPIIIQTTCETKTDAENLAKMLLKKKLVACAQILGPITSKYWWDDDIAESEEFVVSLKTLEDLYGEIEEMLLESHPYDVPEIVAMPVSAMSPTYEKWLVEEIAV